MRRLIGLIALGCAVTLGACTSGGQLTPQAQTALTNLCQQDAVLQPLVSGAVSGVAAAALPADGKGAAVQGALTVENTVVHPMVQDACNKLEAAGAISSSTPSGATSTATAPPPPTPTPAPAAAPASSQ